MINAYFSEFAGYSVRLYEPGQGLENLDSTLYRLAWHWGSELDFEDIFLAYLAEPNVKSTRGLLMGAFGDGEFSTEWAIELLVENQGAFPQLEALFIPDVTYEDVEISWIENTDNAPLLHAFPKLKTFGARGGQGLRFENLKAPQLKTLIVQTGGLARDTLQDLMAADLKGLEHLELYFGTSDYGADFELIDLAPLFEGVLCPNLKYLGLKNSENQDLLTQAVVQAPLLKQLEVLDLSLGTLSDEGARALIQAQEKLSHLKEINLSHHFITEPLQAELQALNLNLLLADPQEPDDDYRFVSISE